MLAPALLSAMLAMIPGARVIELELVPTGRPQIAIWLEDDHGTFIDTILITRLTGTYGLGNRPGRGDFGSGYLWPYGAREMVLPVWAHRRGVEYDRLVFEDCHENAIRYHNPISSQDHFYCRPTTPAENMVDTITCPTTRFDSCKGIPLSLIDGGASADCADIVRRLSPKTFYPPRNDVGEVRAGFDWDGVSRLSMLNDLDAVSAATPPENELFHTSYALSDALAPGNYRIWIEVSDEGDFNADYSTPFFHDPVEPEYGIEFLGQPSIVWRAEINIGEEPATALASDYLGYGSSDGSDGELRPADATITAGVAGSGAERLLVLPGDANRNRLRVSFNPQATCEPPQPIEDLRAVASDFASIQLAFTAITSAVDYDVRYAEGPDAIRDVEAFQRAIRVSTPRAQPDESVAFRIDQLRENTIYTIGVRSRGACGLVSDVRSIEASTAQRVYATVDACFIATAAYGSKEEAHVVELRHFRDRVLMQSVAGRAFVDAYYAVSPSLASVVREHETLKRTVRAVLGPIVELIKE